MRTIYKYQPEFSGAFTIDTHKGARLLDAQYQYGALAFWFLVDTDKPLETRSFVVHGTGHDLGKVDEAFLLTHVSSVQEMGGRLVWHIFEVLAAPR